MAFSTLTDFHGRPSCVTEIELRLRAPQIASSDCRRLSGGHGRQTSRFSSLCLFIGSLRGLVEIIVLHCAVQRLFVFFVVVFFGGVVVLGVLGLFLLVCVCVCVCAVVVAAAVCLFVPMFSPTIIRTCIMSSSGSSPSP